MTRRGILTHCNMQGKDECMLDGLAKRKQRKHQLDGVYFLDGVWGEGRHISLQDSHSQPETWALAFEWLR